MRAAWSDDQVATLKQLFDEGWSFSQIAAKLGGGISRNACIGKFHRVFGANYVRREKAKEKKVRTVSHKNHGPIQQRINSVKQFKAEPFVCQNVADVVPLHLSILEVTDQTCKFPYGDGPITFCGNPVGKGPYCPAHRSVAYIAPQRRYQSQPTELGKARGGVFGRVA